ncbi:hydrogenase [bacterium]|nr:hydrogenase [bacterium]
MNALLLSLVLIVLGGFLPLFLVRKFQLMNALGLLLITCGCITGLIPAFDGLFNGNTYSVLFTNFRVFPLSFELDPISAFFLFPIFFISLLGRLYSFQYLNNTEKALGIAVNNLFYSLLVVSMALVVYAGDLFSFAISWEVMSISSFFLVLFNYQKESTRKAAYLYFVFTQAGAFLIFAGFGVIIAYTGDLGFNKILALPEEIKILVFLLLLLGFGSKAGMFPLHIWLPYAHPAAPSHVSAIMSGVMIKIGIYGIIRFYCLLNSNSILFGYLVLCFGILSGVFGVVQMLGQQNLKRLLAYCSVENIGIILIGLGIGMIGVSQNLPAMALLGFSGAFLHILNHALFKSLLFMGAGSVIHKSGFETIDQMGGYLKKMKVTGVTFLVGSLAITGLPPFNGFISEFLIYYGSFQGISFNETGFIPSALGIISLALIGGLALAGFTKVFGIVFLGEPRKIPDHTLQESGLIMQIPMIILAVICLLIGVFPDIFIRLSLLATNSIPQVSSNVSIEGVLAINRNISFTVLFFIVLVMVLWGIRTLFYRNKTITASSTWGCGYTKSSPRIQYTGTSFVATFLNFFKPIAPVEVIHFDVKGHFPSETSYHSDLEDLAETGLVRWLIRPILAIFNRLRWIQHGDIHLYIGYILLAVIILLLII